MNAIALFGPGLILSCGEDGSVRQWDLKKVFDGVMTSSSGGL